MTFDIVIVGGGHGGAQAAIALRQKGFAGSIAIIGAEPDPPYERPPLSKAYLLGAKTFERLMIRPLTFWSDRSVELLLGRHVVRVDPDAHSVTCDDDSSFGYGTLVWAAGGAARRLSCSGSNLTGVHTIRTRLDVDRLITELPGCERISVVGGGYIGLEAAAALIQLGKQVTVFEAQDRVLERVAGAALSRFYEAEHHRRGVTLRLTTTIEEIRGNDGRVTGVVAHDGTEVPADAVIVGIGIVPATVPLIAAGAQGSNGVRVDPLCATSLPDTFAIGDCALHVNLHAEGKHVRLESVQNANDMASTVAGALTGTPVPYTALPWFWSDQYDLKLQTVGLSSGHDLAVVRGDIQSRSFSVVYFRKGRVIALDCVNTARDFVQGRALVAARVMVDPARVADATTALKDFAVSALA